MSENSIPTGAQNGRPGAPGPLCLLSGGTLRARGSRSAIVTLRHQADLATDAGIDEMAGLQVHAPLEGQVAGCTGEPARAAEHGLVVAERAGGEVQVADVVQGQGSVRGRDDQRTHV